MVKPEVEPLYEFTPELIDEMADIWMRSTVALLDVRCRHIDPQQPLLHYRMPSSMLLYICGEPANVQLNQTIVTAGRFGIFHAGKGTSLHIAPLEA